VNAAVNPTRLKDQTAQPNEQPRTVVKQKGKSSLHSSCFSDLGKRYRWNNTLEATASVTDKNAITVAEETVRLCNCTDSGLIKALEHRDAIEPMERYCCL
jgi:hypothetical protein